MRCRAVAHRILRGVCIWKDYRGKVDMAFNNAERSLESMQDDWTLIPSRKTATVVRLEVKKK